MGEKIFLKDIFRFDELLSKHELKGKRIKLRFNKNWGRKEFYFDFVQSYKEQSDLFLPYLLSMSNHRNNESDIQFQFIEVEYHKWLFVGAYLIKEKDSQSFYDEKRGWDVRYALAEKLTTYEKYEEKILVDFTNRGQSWFYVNTQIINSVPVYELLSKSYFEKSINFPGYENLSMSYEELKKHWNNRTWREHLSTVYGVYLITDTKTGKQYVGSAYGDNGIYGRWSVYLSEGYDKSELEAGQYPNKRLKEIVDKKGIEYIKKHFQYSILEIFSKNEIGKQKALNREKYWKNVLKSKEFGYNAN